jgi:hypothetical protein
MIVLGAAVFGILSGVMTARKRGGTRLDQAQYGAGFGIAFAILGLFATIALEWLA